MGRIQISGGLLACMVAVFSQIAQVLFLPGFLSKLCGQDAWLAVLISGAAGTAIALLAAWVSVRHPGQGPAQIARTLLGKWAGGMVGLIYAGFYAWIFSLVLRNILDFSVILLLPGTPGRVVVSLFAAVALYAVCDGLEPIARVSFQVLIAIIVAAVVLPALQVREFRMLQIDPFLYHGPGSVLRAAAATVPWFGESTVVMSLVAHLKHPRAAYRWIIAGMAGGTLLLTTVVAQTVFIFGPNLPSRFLFPTYVTVEMISIAKSVERVEVAFVIVWLSGMWLKAAFYLFASSEAVSHTLGLKSQRGPAVLFAVAGVLLTQIWRSTVQQVHWTSTLGFQLSHVGIEIGLPAVLLAASLAQELLRGRQPARA